MTQSRAAPERKTERDFVLAGDNPSRLLAFLDLAERYSGSARREDASPYANTALVNAGFGM